MGFLSDVAREGSVYFAIPAFDCVKRPRRPLALVKINDTPVALTKTP